MKKVLSYLSVSVVLILTAVLILMGSFVSGDAYGVPLSDNVYDTVFVETIENLAPAEQVGENSVLNANREPVYDYNLNQLGFVYDFTLNGSAGYAIMVVENGVPEITEIFFDAQNPYENIDGVRVYLTNSTYAYEKDGVFYMTKDGTVVTSDAIAALAEYCYAAYDGYINDSDTIYYASRTLNLKLITPRYPSLYAVSEMTNACVPIAGTNLIAYWDRFATDLIPNYVPGVNFGNFYLYNGDSDTIDNVARQLYSDMNTNNPKPGTNVAQFKQGINTFCNRQGYSVAFESCMSGTKLNFGLSKQKLDAGIPLMLFVDTYAVGENKDMPDDKFETVIYLRGTLAHAMVAFGYQEIDYVLTDGSERHDQYFAVASGMTSFSSAYYNTKFKTQIDDVYAVSIA